MSDNFRGLDRKNNYYFNSSFTYSSNHLNLIERYHVELSKAKGFSLDTVTTYISCVQRFISYAKNTLNKDPADISRKDLDSFLAEIYKQYKGSTNVIHFRSALSAFYEMLFKMKITKTNPASKLNPFLKIKRGKRNAVEKEHIIKLLKSIDRTTDSGQTDYLIISSFWALGLRNRELRMLKAGDFKVIDEHNKMALLKINGKGAKQRSLFVTDKLYDLYMQHLAGKSDKDAFIFPGKDESKPVSEDAVRRHINKIIEDNRLGFKVTPHMLRHSFASAMYNNACAEIDDIKEMLGHDSIRETARYIHLPKEKIKQALSMLTLKGNSHVYSY